MHKKKIIKKVNKWIEWIFTAKWMKVNPLFKHIMVKAHLGIHLYFQFIQKEKKTIIKEIE